MKIRPAKPTDAPIFSTIGAKTFPLACPPNTKPKDIASYVETELSEERFAEHINSSWKTLYAAVVDEAVVGYLMLSLGDAPAEVKAEKPLEVQRVYILPSHHGKGVSGAFMEETTAFAEKHGYDVLWAGVSKHNARGKAFYAKYGFKVVGEQKFPVGDDIHEDLILSRKV